MKCPRCDETMTQGEIGIEATLVDLILGGGGFSELVLREPNQEPVSIMRTADSKPALSCKSCRFFMIIDDPEYSDTECIVCRSAMPAGVISCTKCGWTYTEISK
jgi:hypothetical protein